jgi:5-methylcytosine-specific restriction endonuclease McrA
MCGKVIAEKDERGYWPSQPDFVCDHIIALCLDGKDWWEDPEMTNFQTLCENCNKVKTRRDMRQLSKVRNPTKYLPVYTKNNFEISLKSFDASLKFNQTTLSF